MLRSTSWGLAMVLLVAHPGAIQAQVEVNPATGNRYFLSVAPMGIGEARSLAALVGGHVASIVDAPEQEWTLSVFGIDEDRWIGLSDEIDEGEFLWDSGEPFLFDQWAVGDPLSPDYVIQQAGSGDWSTESEAVYPSGDHRALIETALAIESVGGVAALSCERLGTAVELTWSNASSYDSISVYRNGEFLANLSGSESSFVDGSPTLPTAVYFVQGHVGSLPTLPGTCRIFPLVPQVELYLDHATTQLDQEVELSVRIDHESETGDWDLFAWTFGVCHEPDALELLEVHPGAATAGLAGGDGPWFHVVQLHDEGFAVSTIVSMFGQDLLPEGTAQELEVATYRAVAPEPMVASLLFCDTIGDPPVTTTVALPNGFFYIPQQTAGSVTIVDESFLRGDCDGSGEIALPDPIFMGTYLFLSGTTPPCVEACDVAGGGSLTITDMIALLGYLFTSGPPPVAPFPECGTDPDPAGSLGCVSPLLCP